MPRKISSEPVSVRDIEPEGGPRFWLLPRLEAAYSAMRPREEAEKFEAGLADRERRFVQARTRRRVKPGRRPAPAGPLVSRLQPGRADDVLAEPAPEFWRTRLQEYYQRKEKATAGIVPRVAVLPGMPALPGANNWVPIGPALAARGQADGRPAIGGRTSRLAIAASGSRMYAATANGGVFRSDDGGDS